MSSARTYLRSCSVVVGVGFGVFSGKMLEGAWRAPLPGVGLREVARGGVPSLGEGCAGTGAGDMYVAS